MSKLKYYDGTNWKIVNGQVTGDTLPIGAIVEFDGQDIPAGWEEVTGTNKIKKVSQSAGLIANISKTYSTSQSDTYSCDFINDCNLYSTTETFTGKYWINGKPIYRVCKNVGYLPNNSRIVPEFTGLMPLGSTITHLDGICHRFASDIHDYRPVSDCVITYLFRTTYDTPKLFIDTNQDMSAWECIAIVEYTKP